MESAKNKTIDEYSKLNFSLILPQDFLKVSDSELKIQETMLAEIKKLRAENNALELKEKELQNIITLAEELDKFKNKKIQTFESLIKNYEAIGNNDTKIIENLKNEINIIKQENTFLKEEIQKVRKSKNKRAIIIAILAYVAGALSPVKF